MALSSLLPILLNASLIFDATLLIPTVAAKAIRATTRAYSIKSWPCSSRRNSRIQLAAVFIGIVSFTLRTELAADGAVELAADFAECEVDLGCHIAHSDGGGE